MPHFCTICGVVIAPAQVGPGEVPGQDLEWHQTLRIVGREGILAPATLGGIGYINSLDEIVAPPNAEDSFLDSHAALQSYVPFFDESTGHWTFAFHAACWEILLQRIPPAASNIPRISAILHDILYCTAWDGYCFLRPGHDFGGAAQFQRAFSNPVRNMIDRGYAHLLASPSRLPTLKDVVRPVETRNDLPGIIQRFAITNDIFSRLPVELLSAVLTCLPSSSVGYLRLASRSVASATRPTSLPQHFWRSRFLPSFEMGFALPIETDGHQDWRGAYFAIKAAINHSQGSEKLKSRRRVWNIVSFNATLIQQHMADIVLSGHLCAPDDSMGSQSSSDAVQRLSTRFVATQLMTNPHGLLQVGSRSIFDRSLLLPVVQGAITLVEVLTVTFNTRPFISGFRFTLSDAVAGDQKTRCVGYTSHTMQALARLSTAERVVGFGLAVCAGGIVGARLVLRSGSHTYRSRWIGNIQTNGSEVAFGDLYLRENVDSIHIVSSFDYQTFNRFLNINFGGVHGRRLTHLTRIVGHMFTSQAPLVGLSFYYDQQDPLHFGRQGMTEVSFIIDGPTGERIERVTYEQASTSQGIVTLHLLSNFGNGVTFMADQLAGPYVADASAFFFPGHQQDSIHYTKEALQAPDGQTILGFTSVLEASSGSFQTFGLQCGTTDASTHRTREPLGALPGICTAPADSSPFQGSSLIKEASKGCQGYTTASLEGVKRVRFSRGCPGRPRRSDEISGLWLEYSHDSRPSIVGQWISETGSFALGQDETITEITMWLSKGRISFSEKYPLGRVVRIAISTRTRCKTHPPGEPPAASEHTILRFRGNYLEELSQLIWVFNDAWDFPRVTLATKAPGHHLSLWDPLNAWETRRWMAPQRALWKFNKGTNSLVSMTFFRSSEYPQVIGGIKVTYESGHSFDLGTVGGTTMTSGLRFEPSDCITKVELFRDSLGLIDISFSCTDAKGGQFTTKALVGVSTIQHRARGDISRHVINISQRKYRLLFEPWKDPSREQDLPQGEVVGLWGFDMAERGLFIGLVICQKDSD
ncbi:hypothetical protein BO78DRAFT_308434 [Aspergillus sclerotiicarbonarius CBS 121057]|uniref:DUF7600 domain-containing protein n=1 Tax=Aspergillus sclerotiicarbonarius (strain CBS 121057 / IBT 28362) TaxID=1448318 RepID=A0A319EGG2_ASPSB|nr:hypothetical protein BO78DRAFT_308434 [Aspergillus sclerotiicarbonarius CBS 121057]